MDKLYAYSTAPRHSYFPVLFTRCTPAERAKVIARVASKITKKRKWRGAYLSPKSRRGIVRIKNAKGATVTVLAYHAVLAQHGYYPSGDRNVCSHLCHNSACVKVEHLCWSSSNENALREDCRVQKKCVCNLARECHFGCI